MAAPSTSGASAIRRVWRDSGEAELDASSISPHSDGGGLSVREGPSAPSADPAGRRDLREARSDPLPGRSVYTLSDVVPPRRTLRLGAVDANERRFFDHRKPHRQVVPRRRSVPLGRPARQHHDKIGSTAHATRGELEQLSTTNVVDAGRHPPSEGLHTRRSPAIVLNGSALHPAHKHSWSPLSRFAGDSSGDAGLVSRPRGR
jgi:hypothetical protein